MLTPRRCAGVVIDPREVVGWPQRPARSPYYAGDRIIDLMMLADSMMPEAFEHGGRSVGC